MVSFSCFRFHFPLYTLFSQTLSEAVFVSGVRRMTRIFAPQTRRFSAAILGGLQGEATQYASKKTAQAVCNAYENGFFGAVPDKQKVSVSLSKRQRPGINPKLSAVPLSLTLSAPSHGLPTKPCALTAATGSA